MRGRKIFLALAGLAACGLILLASATPCPAAEQPRPGKTARQFDYRVVTVQYGRATFVNGTWIGTVQPREGNTDVAIRSCPQVHEYLQAAGAEGWELTVGFSQRAGVNPAAADDTTQTLFLKRER